MKKHPNDEPVPLHAALWLENHERIDAMLKPCPFCGSKAYKMLGNGWTVDVIAHILKGLKEAN